MRGQGALEYMLIFAAFLVIIASVTQSQMIAPARDLARDTEKLATARFTSDKIASAINTVYKSEGSRTTKFVTFSGIENLNITEDNVQLSVLYRGKRLSVGSDIEYGFENSISNVPNGSYTLVVGWNSGKSEGIWLKQDEDEVNINIRPGGG